MMGHKICFGGKNLDNYPKLIIIKWRWGTLSGVGEPILDLNIRYHCPIYCVLNLNKHKSTAFARHIWLYDRGDYASFANELTDTYWNLLKNNDINIYANNITEHI